MSTTIVVASFRFRQSEISGFRGCSCYNYTAVAAARAAAAAAAAAAASAAAKRRCVTVARVYIGRVLFHRTGLIWALLKRNETARTRLIRAGVYERPSSFGLSALPARGTFLASRRSLVCIG